MSTTTKPYKVNYKILAKAHWRDLNKVTAERNRYGQLLARNFICLACGKKFVNKVAVAGHIGASQKHDADCACASVDISLYKGAQVANQHRRLLKTTIGLPFSEALTHRDGCIWCTKCEKKVSPPTPSRLKTHCQSARHKS